MKKIFYEKRGRRYFPVSEYNSELSDSLPKGNHLVMCYPGGQSVRYNIDPAFAPMIAAGRYAENAMLDSMREISKARPTRRELTDEQREAWNALKEKLGDEMFGLSFVSNMEVAQAGIKALIDEADKLLTNPSVRKAYDHFILTAKLAANSEDEPVA